MKNVAKVAGKSMACYRAVGQVMRIMLRSGYQWVAVMADQFGWAGFDKLSEKVIEELRGWRENLADLNRHSMVISSKTTVFEVTLAGDASAVGAYLGNIQSETTLLSFPFSKKGAKGSSTFRELWVLDIFYTSKEALPWMG